MNTDKHRWRLALPNLSVFICVHLWFILLFVCPANAQFSGPKFDALQKSWQDSGSFGKEIGCIVRAASNLDKISLTDLETGRVIGNQADPIRISAARNEYEGFQMILTPLPDGAKHVAVTVSDLAGAGVTIPSSNIQINAVGYVRIFAGEAREKLCPDPLLIGDIPALAPGENQSVWITVYIPSGTPAGEYRGSVTIVANKTKLSIPLLVKVRSFEIPKKISLRSSFWMFRDHFNRFYHLKEIALDDYLKWIDFALQHRMNPIDVYEGDCDQLLDIIQNPERSLDKQTHGLPNPHPDFTKWDKYLDHMVAGGANTINLGMSHHFGGFFSDDQHPVGSPEQIARVEQAIRVLEDHYKAKGVFDLCYLQLRDETSAPDALNVYRAVHKDFPEITLCLTAPSGDARPLLMTPCPLTPGFDAGWRDEVHKNGGEYWWYVCVQPQDPWADLFIFQTGAQHRALFWQTWSHHVDGLLYWGMNFWSPYGMKWNANARSQTTRIPPADAQVVEAIPSAPGDGFSMYPGPNPATPMSSIRLEGLRDGEEDYEYFIQLDAAIAAAEKSGTNTPVLAQAKTARDDAKKLVENMTGYEKNATPYLAIRARVGDAIEALAK